MRTFKKALLILCCVLLVTAAFASCGTEINSEPPEELAKAVKEKLDSDIVWTELTPDKVAVYFGFSGESARESAVYINDSDEHLDTVAFFDFETKEKKSEAITELNASLTKAAENFKSVNENETAKIQKRLIYESENRLCLVITATPEAIIELLTEKGFSPIK
ncbi:MAG: DUF4358 domain-containing protein [Clostridiales bacterium]|nr:DUF4358 domain-containing protein [Candidatus Equinaster intestinalis]